MLVVDQQAQNTVLVTAWNRERRRCAELSHPPTCCHHKAFLMVGLNMLDIECFDCFSKHYAQPEIGKSPGVRTDLTPLGQEPGASRRSVVWPRWGALWNSGALEGQRQRNSHDPFGCRSTLTARWMPPVEAETEAGSSTRCTSFAGVSLQLRRPDTAPSTDTGYTLFELVMSVSPVKCFRRGVARTPPPDRQSSPEVGWTRCCGVCETLKHTKRDRP